jgi:hypothetical protein
LREVLREVFVISYQKHEHLMLIFLQRLKPLDQGNIFLKPLLFWKITVYRLQSSKFWKKLAANIIAVLNQKSNIRKAITTLELYVLND